MKSTAEVTMGGVYDGSAGTMDLSFVVASGGLKGTDNLAVEVYAADGTLTDTINIAHDDAADQLYQLSNGLTFQLGAGHLETGESFQINVNDTVGSSVNPDLAFNGLRNENPNFDTGLQVTAGSFEVNNVQIDVHADDTINSVLARITDSSAGVDATFDVASESVVLTSRQAGETILLGADTSGSWQRQNWKVHLRLAAVIHPRCWLSSAGLRTLSVASFQ